MDDKVAQFVELTSTNEDTARQVLAMCAFDLERAIHMWFNDEELQRNLTTNASASFPAEPSAAPEPSSRRAPAPVPHSIHPMAGRVDERGVIHIDSDDDDIPMNEVSEPDYFDEAGAAAEAAVIARTAQEEEDAAMAKKLQEELYQGQDVQEVDEFGVRAPLARTTETLVGPSAGGAWGPDDMEDVNSEILEQLRRRRHPPARTRINPFTQSIWDDPPSQAPSSSASRGPAGGASSGQGTRAQRLAELFRPPYDLISQFSWDEAREEGKEEKKWILVNLQDMTDFNCQALNRDIWKDQAVQQLVKENFIFLQYSKTDPQANQYISFYFLNQSHENPDNYPHVSIVDPRTGEQVKVWSGIPFPSAADFLTELVGFLERYSLAANSKNPVVTAKRPERVIDVDRMTEEEMLEMALQNSLATNGNNPKPNVHDPDELTKSIGGLPEPTGSGKGKARADAGLVDLTSSVPAESSAAAQQQSVFAGIPSDRPHVEPASDPAATTRIQFRHPTGRVIRRFNLDDSVTRIYEWLKAEPLEGKDGVEFELKGMPQGHDLIGDLGKTIAEAGLKQGTVMIEFIEE